MANGIGVNVRGEGRESILRAAFELMLTDRMSAVSHRSVATRAQVALGLIRYHFATRSALLLACVTLLMDRRHDAAVAAVAAASPDLDGVACGRLVVTAYAGPDVSDDGLSALLACLIDSAREDDSLAEYLLSVREVVEQDIRAVLRACGRDEILGPLLAHVVDGALIAAIIDKQPGLLDAAARSCATIFELAARPSPRAVG